MSVSEDTPTRRQKVEQRESAILQAAKDAFLQDGYDGARMSDIARRAGIAEGTVYLYFKTKSDLMQAFVADFWSDLTRSARAAVDGQDDTLRALHALATFHITTLIDRFDIVELTQSGRMHGSSARDNRSFMRVYVSVFDDIWNRGVDRGVLDRDVPIWLPRDVFYGSLEYSARTLLLHPEREVQHVVEHLMILLRTRFTASPSGKGRAHLDNSVFDRLEAVVDRLERRLDK